MFDPFEPGRKYTVQEYFRLEEISEIKHDFRYGFVHPVGEPPPPIPIANAQAVFTAVSSRVLTLINQTGATARLLAEPDDKGAVICARLASEDIPTPSVGFSKPAALFIVTSIATFVGTRGKLFDAYRQKESIQEIAWIFADRPKAEIYRRGVGTTWNIEFIDSIDSEILFRSLGVRFRFADLYDIPGFAFVIDPLYPFDMK